MGTAAVSACAQASAIITLRAPGYFCLQQEDGWGQSPEIAEAVSGRLIPGGGWSMRTTAWPGQPQPRLWVEEEAAPTPSPRLALPGHQLQGASSRVLRDPGPCWAEGLLQGTDAMTPGGLGYGGLEGTSHPHRPPRSSTRTARVQGLESRSADRVKAGGLPLSSVSWAESQPLQESVFSAGQSAA